MDLREERRVVLFRGERFRLVFRLHHLIRRRRQMRGAKSRLELFLILEMLQLVNKSLSLLSKPGPDSETTDSESLRANTD